MGRRNAILAPLMIVALVAAGCTGDAPAPSPEPDDPTRSVIRTSATQGAIEGVVVSDELLPIPNATVSISRPNDASTIDSMLTAPDGGFAFGPLQPGTYVVAVTAHGFGDSSGIHTVHADQVTRVQFLLAAAGGNNPYVELQIREGFIACGFAGIIESFSCATSTTEPVLGQDVFSIRYAIPAGHRATIVETTWDQSTQTLHNWFWGPYDESLLVQPWLGDAVGPPPLRKTFLPDARAPSIRPFPGEHASYPSSETEFELQVQTYYDGFLQREANQTAGQVCALSPRLGYCSGVGVTAGFRFSQFVTIFVGEHPGDLAVYTAVPDT